MTRQGGFGSGGPWKNVSSSSSTAGPVKFLRSSAAVPLFLVGGITAVVVTAGAVSLYNAMEDDNQDGTGTSASFGDTGSTGTGSGYHSGYHGTYWGGSSFSSGGSSSGSHPASGGGTSRGGFGGTGHAGGGS